MRCRLPFYLSLCAVVLAAGAVRADPAEDCDRLAAVPGADGAGVALEAIDAEAAILACGQAISAQPGEPRFLFQYGRALERSGDIEGAARLYEWAAADGFAPAQDALGGALPTDSGVPADLDASALAAILEDMATALDAQAASLPQTGSDPAAVLAEAGTSIAALTGWVGREVALVPYRGTLRGARGALMDRHGNSLDRALLLAGLLTSAGHEVRLAHTLLEMPAARLLLATVAAPPADSAQPAGTTALADKLVDAAGPLAGALQAELAAATEEALAQRASVAARTADLAPVLLALADRVPPPVGEPGATALADHWWVQVREGEAWIDADPSAAIVGTLSPRETLAPADVPETLQHAVTLRLVIEFWDNGSLRTAPVFTHRLTPAGLIDRPVVLRQVPVSAPSLAALAAAGGDSAAAMLTAATEAWVWQPVLQVGDEIVTDRLFTMAGEVLPAGRETLSELGLSGQIFGDVTGSTDDAVFALGGTPLAPAPPDEANAAVRVSAEWLEVEITPPDAAPEIHRRTVFDLIGAAARSTGTVAAPILTAEARLARALALLQEADVSVVAGSGSGDASRIRLARDSARLLRAIAAALGSGADWTELAAGDLPRLPLPLYGLAALRFADPGIWLDRPNVVLSWSGLSWSGLAGADLRPFQRFDIVANRVAVAAPDAFAARLAQGVRDTVAEDVLAGPGPTGNTAALHDIDRAAGRAWVRLAPNDAAALASLALPADAVAAIAADLARGAQVVAPPAPVDTAAGPQVAWWRIDPDGTTLGMAPTGGQAMTENGFLIAQGTQFGLCFFMLGRALGGGDAGGAAAGAICASGALGGGVAVLGGAVAGGGIVSMVAAILAAGVLLETG